MKITCQSCSAKYTIADDKVRGKTVKIKCKKCGATIVAGPEAGPSEGAAASQEWLINVADGDQRSLTPALIADLHRQGVVNDDTFAWREGMDGWAGLRSIPEIAEALGVGEAVASEPLPVEQPPAEMDDLPTRMGPAADFGMPAAAVPAAGAPAPRPAAGAPAARRVAAAPARDLFSAPAEEDEEVVTRIGSTNELSGGGSSAFAPIGAKPGPARRSQLPEPPMAGAAEGEASGIIDIQKLQGALMAKKPPPKRDEKMDDIMNLGGGAMFASSGGGGSALAPPDFSTPMPPEPEPPRPVAAAPMPQVASPFVADAPKKSSKGPLIGGILALVAVLGVGGVVMSQKSKPTEADKTAADDKKTADPSSPGDKKAADVKATTPDPSTDKKPDEKVAVVDHKADLPDLPPGKELTPEEKKRRDEAFKKKKEEDEKKKAAAEEEKKKKEEEEKKKAAAAANPAADAPGGDKPFDRAAAGSALGSIAAGVGSCKKGDGPSGAGRIAVTFAPSGNVTTATIEGGDFAGTSVGGCIAARFRSAKVSPFSGGAVTVKKSFTVN